MKRNLKVLAAAAAALAIMIPAPGARAAVETAFDVDSSIPTGTAVTLSPGLYLVEATGTFRYIDAADPAGDGRDLFSDAECSQKVRDARYPHLIDDLAVAIGLPMSEWIRDSYGRNAVDAQSNGFFHTGIELLDPQNDRLDLTIADQDQLWVPTTPTLFSGGSNPFDGNPNAIELGCNTAEDKGAFLGFGAGDHAYVTPLLVTSSGPTTFAVRDSDYSDNIGSLHVRVVPVLA